MHALVILWHPPEGGFAGGFLLSRRYLELSRAFTFTAIDSDSTDITATEGGPLARVVRIPERLLQATGARTFAFARIVNWAFHAFASIVVGVTQPRFDFVLVLSSEIPANSLPAAAIAAIRRKPLIFVNLNVRGQRLWSFNRVVHRRARGIATISAALEAEIQAELPESPTARFTLGVDDASVPRSPEPAWDAIFVGRHVEEKGVFELLDIWQRVLVERPGAKLAMVGPCEASMRSRLEAAARERGFADGVSLLGPVDEARKWALYADAKICVFPSWIEGWGLVPVEANLAGIPAVAYDLEAYAENIANSPAATLVPLHDTAAFADAIVSYLNDPPDSTTTRAWARKFDWPTAMLGADRAIASLLAASGAQSS